MSRDRRENQRALDKCPDKANHTPAPRFDVAWYEWAQTMYQTHEQIRCTTCGLFAIWIHRQDGAPDG